MKKGRSESSGSRTTPIALSCASTPRAPPRHRTAVLVSGSTRVIREDFPQLLKAVIATYWPPVVQDKNCEMPVMAGEGYSGSQCTGTFLEAPPLPEAPRASSGEDYPGPPGFNAIGGERLNIIVRLHLSPTVSGAPTGAGN